MIVVFLDHTHLLFFIGSMHTGMLLRFHWNVFKYAVVCFIETYLIVIYICCLIYVVMIYNYKMA